MTQTDFTYVLIINDQEMGEKTLSKSLSLTFFSQRKPSMTKKMQAAPAT